jgi:Putative bacterial sensory transduction regulator
MPPAETSPSAAARVEVRPDDIERWLKELDLDALARADREGVASWDLELDGRRRFDVRVTLILDPQLALICWVHLAPPIGDRFRASYRKLLRWNDEYPFVKFAIAEDERPVLSAEIPITRLDRDELGLALARLLAIADAVLEETAEWLWLRGEIPAGYADRRPRNAGLLERYAARLEELSA